MDTTQAISGYHGAGETITLHIGFCLTPEYSSAGHYAEYNAGPGDTATVHEIIIDIVGLTLERVEYDYDGCEPVLTGGDADIAVYEDCDEYGDTHTTYMLLTDAAVAATITTTATPAVAA